MELPNGELTADFLERMQMRTGAGTYVPLADIVSVDRRTGFSTVRRENGLRLINVKGDISEDDPARAAEVTRALEEDILPEIAAIHQVEWRMSGLSEQEDDFLNDARLGLILTLAGIYLVLAWVFASWTRPMVVMAIIPFGLVGTIYGHLVWDVPLSMFTVVGLLGMTGIIINDSIVLVTTIDDYAKDRGVIPSIIDGAADRLRPVMLTTATTVLGLTPLLFERSQQAQFLKPTVITLVYGLGFGMVLVLLLVPALMAIQHDFGRRRAALRRALAMRVQAVRFGMGATALAILAWLAATMGTTLFTGALPPVLIQTVPKLEDYAPLPAALAVYITGSAALILLVLILFAVARRIRRQPAGQP